MAQKKKLHMLDGIEPEQVHQPADHAHAAGQGQV